MTLAPRRTSGASRTLSTSLLALAIGLAMSGPTTAIAATVTVRDPSQLDGNWYVPGAWSNGDPNLTVENHAYIDSVTPVVVDAIRADSWRVDIGHGGSGELFIQNGGVLESTAIFIATLAGSTGKVTVTGAGSQWIGNNSIGVGHEGSGFLDVLDGGQVINAQGTWVASEMGSSGVLTVSDKDSRFATDQIHVGAQGMGTVNVRNGGSFQTGVARLGSYSSVARGEATVTGKDSSWLNSSDLLIGVSGTGTMTVADGATLTVQGSTLLGQQRHTPGVPDGVLVLTGAGTTATTGFIAVGQNAVAELNVFDGAALTAGNVGVGESTQGEGSFRVADAGSSASMGRLTVGNQGNGSVSVYDGGALTVNDALGLAGASGSRGSLTIGPQGTLNLAGGLIYQGAGTATVLIADGTLHLTSKAFTSNVEMALDDVATVDTDQVDAMFSGRLTGTGALRKTGNGTLTTHANNSYSGGTRIEQGTLVLAGNGAIRGAVDVASGATLQLQRNGQTLFNNVLSGAGDVVKLDAGLLSLSGDSSGFTGTTRVQAGALDVHGRLGGLADLGTGTELSGDGQLGNVVIRDGATLAPGSATAFGTLSMTGSLLMKNGSRYLVDLGADGAGDRVQVGGGATLQGGNTVAIASEGDWQPRTRYTILSATQGVQGTFSGVSSTLAFLTPTLDYDASNVYLTLARNDIAMPDIDLAFPDVVVNPNQKAVAGAVEALGNGNAVYEAVVRLDLAEVVPAFDSLSGEIHAAHRGALLQNRFLHEGIDRHLDGATMGAEIAPGVHAWIGGNAGQRRTDAGADNTGLRSSQHGVMAGAGWRLGESLEVGVAAGQQQLVSRLAQRDARSETDSTEYGVYGQYRWQGLSLRAGVSRADYRTDSTRTAQVGTRLDEGLSAREDATGTTAFLRAGWTFGGARLQLTPEIEVAQVRLQSDGSQEHGGHSALQWNGGSARYRTGLAALRADWDISGGQRDRAALTARVGWQVAGGDRLPQVDARFVEGTQGFAISGAPLARRSALAQFGVAVSPTDNSRVALQMQGRRGDGQRDVGAQLDWSVAF